MSENDVANKWAELKELVSALDLDVVKNANGNSAAGVRARKGLRELKRVTGELVKQSVNLDKVKKAAKPSKDTKQPVAVGTK